MVTVAPPVVAPPHARDLLALLLAVVLVCVAASGLLRGLPASAGARSRAAGLTEAVLAAAMAGMLVGAV